MSAEGTKPGGGNRPQHYAGHGRYAPGGGPPRDEGEGFEAAIARHPSVRIEMSHKRFASQPTWAIDRLEVRPEDRGQGLAAAALRDLIARADSLGVYLALTPEETGAAGGLSTAQLRKWYGRHGFHANKGRHPDLTESMVRAPTTTHQRGSAMTMTMLYRAMPVADMGLGPDGRSVVLKLLTYGRDYRVSDDGARYYTERWRSGAFKRSVQHGHGGGVPLSYEHDVPGLPRALPVGRSNRAWEDAGALMLEGRISRTSAGDDLVELLRDEVIRNVSVHAAVHRSIPFVGGHERLEASLRGVAFTTLPQYEDAELVAIRSGPEPGEDDDEGDEEGEGEGTEAEGASAAPSATPALDTVRARLDALPPLVVA